MGQPTVPIPFMWFLTSFDSALFIWRYLRLLGTPDTCPEGQNSIGCSRGTYRIMKNRKWLSRFSLSIKSNVGPLRAALRSPLRLGYYALMWSKGECDNQDFSDAVYLNNLNISLIRTIWIFRFLILNFFNFSAYNIFIWVNLFIIWKNDQ